MGKDNPDKSKINPYRFYSIPYLKDKLLDFFGESEEVWIEEKIDGSNVCCEVDDANQFRCYGRKYELGEWYSNSGSYQKLLAIEDKVRANIPSNLVLYFEYLSKHHVKYADDKVNILYLIGVYDKSTNKYLLPNEVYKYAEVLGLTTPVCFYNGQFKDWSIARGLVGKSAFGAEQGEGVIVKAYDKQTGIKMIKIVGDAFKEVMKQDTAAVQAKIDEAVRKREIVQGVVTPARIRKQLYKMQEEGLISSVENMSEEDRRIAIKHIGGYICADCSAEEPELVESLGKDFGKYAFIISRQYIEGGC